MHFIKTGKKDNDTKWIDPRDIRHIHCVRPGKCEKLKNATCFGYKLPYTYSSLDLTDSDNQEKSRERLFNYEALRNIPKCWAVIQVSRLFSIVSISFCTCICCQIFHFCSPFCVLFLCRNANEWVTLIWYFCPRWKCVASP